MDIDITGELHGSFVKHECSRTFNVLPPLITTYIGHFVQVT